MKIEITENMVKNANAYIPVMEKEKLAAIIAENAVEPVKVQIDGLASGVKAVPDIKFWVSDHKILACMAPCQKIGKAIGASTHSIA